MKPIPLSSSATPTTIPNRPSLSAMYEVLRAVVNAVSVTQRSRAPFATGRLLAESISA